MKLKLWEKSFLLTFTVFLILLNTGLVLWYLFDVKNDYQDFADECRQEAESILYFGEEISREEAGARQLEEMADRYEGKGVFFRLTVSDTALVDRLPRDTGDGDAGRQNAETDMGRLEAAGEDYYYIDTGFNACRLVYMKSLKGVYERYWNMARWMLLVDVVLAAVVGALLYAAMRKIHKPVSDISHELRTPLTSVLGYAQYLSMDAATDAEKAFAGEQIVREAKYMKDIVERLLTVESLRGSSVKKERVDLREIVEELKEKYPKAMFENQIDHVKGDRTLVRIMLSNLMENAVREDPGAAFDAEGGVIRISNKAPGLTDRDIRSMNSGKRLDDEKIKGHGVGVELCREIAAVHGWEIRYELEDGKLSVGVFIRG